jgi:membrane protease YdiL (CAAX protease family)
MERRRTASIATVIGIAIALGWPFLFFWQGSKSIGSASQDVGTIVKEWAFTLLVLAIVLLWERRPLSSLGLRLPNWMDLGAMLVAGVGTLVVAGTAAALTEQGGHVLHDVNALLALPFALRLGIALTAGICEETLTRGFATERLLEIFGKPWIAFLIVALAFGLAHIPRYGLNASLLVPTVTGAGLTLLYLWRRNLVVCIILHSAIDAMSLLLGPAGHA